MTILLYNVFCFLYSTGIRIAGLFNAKASKWITGRRDIFSRLQNDISISGNIIWMHCASLGEFEQGRPVLEQLRQQYPQVRILLTFFSPSGYEVRKNFAAVDWVYYLPMDSSRNAKKFLQIVQPSLVVFVKYDYWYHYLYNVNKQKIPLLLISAIFRNQSPFFKWYGSLHRQMLSFFSQLFVQTADSKALLQRIGFDKNVTVAGDTRFDRVLEIATQFEPILAIENFIDKKPSIVAGSTWLQDEMLLQKAILQTNNNAIKLIVAPHEVNEAHLRELEKIFPNAIRFSQLQHSSTNTNCLIIDNIGMLSRLYFYGSFCYVGGGFNKSGIHNSLEAAVFGKPIFFGPNYSKFREAVNLLAVGAAFSCNDAFKLSEKITQLLLDKNDYDQCCRAAKELVQNSKGATKSILHYIQENRLLIN